MELLDKRVRDRDMKIADQAMFVYDIVEHAVKTCGSIMEKDYAFTGTPTEPSILNRLTSDEFTPPGRR